ncbi:MAG: hypothetical protein ACXACY_28215, partial [Candidatus Hodarchaeales archaeon]
NWKYLNYDSMSIRWIPHILWLDITKDSCVILPKNQISAECMYIENIQTLGKPVISYDFWNFKRRHILRIRGSYTQF